MLKLLINNGDGKGPIDYTKYVIPTSLQMEDSINTPTLLSFTLVNVDNSFLPPVRSAYVQWVSTQSPLSATGALLFTGYITNNSEFKYLGLGGHASLYPGEVNPGPYAQAGPLFQHYEIDVKCTSDEYLLNTKSVPFIAAYINQTMGQILKNIANTLAPAFFDTTNVQDSDLVPYFTYDPTQKWSDVAKQFADQSQYRYKVIGKKIYFTPFGDAPLGVFYDETVQRQAQFVPGALETGILQVPLVNDCLVVGDVEPQQNHDDYFCGDGFTGSFALKYKMFQGDTNLLLQDDWTEGTFNSSQWFVQDLAGQFVLAGALNCIGVNLPLGTAYILGQSGVELGGHLLLQHGEFQFNDKSTGLVGGIYQTTSNLTGPNCIAGFNISNSAHVAVTSSGADGVIIQPMISGNLVGTPVTTVHNHHYILETYISAREPFRYQQIYRSLAGTPFGNYSTSALGDVTMTIQDIDLALAYNIATLNNPFVPSYIPVITKYTAFNIPLPSFAAYVILNSGGIDPNTGVNGSLNLTVNYTVVSRPPQANLYVASLTGAQPRNPLALTGGQLPPYNPQDPLAEEDTLPIGPYQHYRMGTGIDLSLVGTVSLVGDLDQLKFYSPLYIPGVGARIKLQAWQSGHAIARVRDPVSVAREAAIVGDDGVRSMVVNDLKPTPRTSYECDYAAQAMITDREMVQYQGTYKLESLFFNALQDYPRSGRFFNVTAPQRGISGAQFLVREVTTTVLEMRQEILSYSISYGQDLYLDKLLRRFIAQPEGTTGILQPNDTAMAPNPQQIPPPNSAFATYLDNLSKAQVTLITGTQILLDFGSVPVTGVEIRRSDTGWATNTQNLVTVATTQTVTLPRSQWDQTWFMRMVNGSQTSRFTRVVRVNYPMVPQPPSSVAVVSPPTVFGQLVNPLEATVFLPTSFDRNIYGVEIVEPLTLAPCNQITLFSDVLSDTRNAEVLGFDVLGNPLTDTITLAGSTPVTTPHTYCFLDRIELLGAPTITGDVSVKSGGSLLGIVPASGTDLSLGQIIYKYANLTLPYNPNDPGLTYTYATSLTATTPLMARFFNLLNEPSTPLFFQGNPGNIVNTGGFGVSGISLSGCLDVRLFGAKGDGVTDDTHAVQAALNQAYANYQARIARGLANPNTTLSITGNVVPTTSAFGLSGNPLGSTIVCIPSGVYCRVFPRIPDGMVPSGQSSSNAPCTWGLNNFQGWAALQIDDGVTIQCDGALMLGLDMPTICTIVSSVGFNGVGYGIWILENRQAFIGGPLPQVQGGIVTQNSYLGAIATYELGPRNTGIRITGEGIFSCGTRSNGFEVESAARTLQLQLGAINFCKCDQSQIDGLNFQDMLQNPAILWSHSEKVNIFNNTFLHGYDSTGPCPDECSGCGVIGFGSLGIIADVLRGSAIYANRMVDVDSFIFEMANQHTDIHNNIAQQGGLNCQGIHFFLDMSFLFAWQFNESLNADGNRQENHYSNNRGRIWQPNHVYNRQHGDWAVPTSYVVGDHQFVPRCASPMNTIEVGALPVNFMSSGTEPAWHGPPQGTFHGLPVFFESVVSVTGAFVAFGGELNLAVQSYGYPIATPFNDVDPNGNSFVVYLNGVKLVQGPDWWQGQGPFGGATPGSKNAFITLRHSFTFAACDVISMDLRTQTAWLDQTPTLLGSNPCDQVGVIMQLLGGASNSGLTAQGVRVIANQVSDNYQTGIGFAGLKNGQISHSLVQRNKYSYGILDLASPGTIAGCSITGGGHFNPQIIPSMNMQIIDNYCSLNDCGQIVVPPSDGTIDNPQTDSSTFVRAGNTFSFTDPFTETPSPAPNGIVTAFTLTHTPVAGSLTVTLNGLVESSYTLSGKTITFATPPPTGTAISCTYEYALGT